jgi:hypothetical protein
MGRERENDALCSRLLDAFVKAVFCFFCLLLVNAHSLRSLFEQGCAAHS